MGIEKSRQRPRTCQVVDIECLLLSTHIVNGDVLYQSLPQLQICVSTEDLAMSTVSTAAVLFVPRPSIHGPDQQLLAAWVADSQITRRSRETCMGPGLLCNAPRKGFAFNRRMLDHVAVTIWKSSALAPSNAISLERDPVEGYDSLPYRRVP